MKPKIINLDEDAKTIIENLRAEVATQKDCITKYTVMSIGFVGAVWGLASKFETFSLAFYFCCGLMVFMLSVVVRISNHKYATINRHLGYELHLARLIDYARVGNGDWAIRMMNIKWEEAMCAWRFVQPAIFNKVYKTVDEDPNYDETFQPYVRKEAQPDENPYYWYESETLMAKNAFYHSGKYLQNIHRFLYAVAGLAIVSMWVMWIYQITAFIMKECMYQGASRANFWLEIFQFTGAAFLNLITTIYTWKQIGRQTGYREILESGMLSIQTSAVVWRVVATCHILGSIWALSRPSPSYRYYTTYTSTLAVDFVNNGFSDPHIWLNKFEVAYEANEEGRLMTPSLESVLMPILGDAKQTPFKPVYLKPGYPKTVKHVVYKILQMFKKK